MEDEGGPSTSQAQPSFHISVTQKGSELLCRAGYEYHFKRTNNDGSKLWRCAKKKICNATIKIKDDVMTILNETNHCHGPINLENVQVKHQMQICLKDVQKDLHVPVGQVFEKRMEVLKDKGLHLVTKIPNFTT